MTVQAESVLAASYEKLSTAYGVSDSRTRAVSHWLAALYRRTNRTELGDRLLAPTSCGDTGLRHVDCETMSHARTRVSLIRNNI